MSTILTEARRLFDRGFGVHWIKPGSKAPVKAGWSSPTRDDFATVEREYSEGFGLGVRLGQASRLPEGGYLANIDIDLKGGRKFEELAFAVVRKEFPGILETAPRVRTDHGLRLFVRTEAPERSFKLGASAEECLVRLPTAEINKRQNSAMAEGKLTPEQLRAGFRVRPAWEVEFMSAGKQVVLPPSIHPDTGKPYTWEQGVTDVAPLPLVVAPNRSASENSVKMPPVDVRGFTLAVVDLVGSKLSDRILAMILNGTDVSNRSDALLSVSIAMCRAGFSDSEIATVLTDPETYLGETAYEHAHTKSRKAAAAWILKYTVAKARAEVDVAKVFAAEVEVTPALGADAAAAQAKELCEKGELRLKRGGQNGEGAVKPTLGNVIKVLVHVFGAGLFREDRFSGYKVYGRDVPAWGAKAGDEFSDRERPLVTEWLSKKYGFEPPPNVIYDAVAVLAAREPFHPIRDYLEGLAWDGVPRADTWLQEYMRAHDTSGEYLREVSRKVLVAMIARAYEPGCQFDYMLILRGAQGIKKSSALSILAGAKYFSSTVLESGGKEAILKMTAKWVLEFGELSTLRADMQALKNFITTRVDRDRLPYGRVAQDFPRKCIFIGTTNRDDFLSDETGNRRFWPVSVGWIDLAGLARDRDQLLAEAKALYDCGEALYLSADAEEEAAHEQSRWMPAADILVDQVHKVLTLNEAKAEGDLDWFPPDGFKLHEIMARLACRDDMATQKRVGAALRANGYRIKQTRRDGKNINAWCKT